MTANNFVQQIEKDYNVQNLMVEYIKKDSQWRLFNEKFTWVMGGEDKSPGTLARKYLDKPKKMLEGLQLIGGNGLISQLVADISIAFVPMKKFNASACLSPDSERIVLLDLYLDRTLGALAILLTRLRRYADQWLQNKPIEIDPHDLTNFQLTVRNFHQGLKELVGKSERGCAPLFDEIGEEIKGIDDWFLARKYQDGMLFFILLHEIMHHKLGHVKQKTKEFLDNEGHDNHVPESSQNDEFAADKSAWIAWWHAATANPASFDAHYTGIYDFLSDTGGSPFVFLSLLHEAYKLFEPSLAMEGGNHPAPGYRYENLLDIAQNTDYTLHFDRNAVLMLASVKLIAAMFKDENEDEDPF